MNTGIKKRLVVLVSLSMVALAVILATPIANAAAAKTVIVTTLKLTRNLSLGSTGEDVRSLQKFLNSNGYFVATSGPGSIGNETTTFDAATKVALASFQAANGLSESGYVGAATIALVGKWKGTATLPATESRAAILAMVETVKAQIIELQNQLALLIADKGTGPAGPAITAIKISDGGSKDILGKNDSITITFSQAIKPATVNSGLTAGGTVTDIPFSMNGGVSISGYGLLTVKNIASFNTGTVGDSRNFTSKIALDKTGKILTVTLTKGDNVEIEDEAFGVATQVGGKIAGLTGELITDNSNAPTPTGTFGGGVNENDNDKTDNPFIRHLMVSNWGARGMIDTGDMIKIYFNEDIKPESINQFLVKGGSVRDIVSTETGGVSVATSGTVTVKNIATFDMGTAAAGTFVVDLALNSTGRILTITLTKGGGLKITQEEFSDGKGASGTIKDLDGQTMVSGAKIEELTGTFGGVR